MRDSFSFKGAITRLWWVPMVTGLISVAFGIWCMLSPQTSLPVFAYIFAGALCFAALLNFVFAAMNAGFGHGWGWALALGILELFAGIWLFTLPQVILVDTFIFVVGIWILVAAINSICEACMLSSVSVLWTIFMVLLLVATMFFAVIFLSDPIAGGIAVWLWIGISMVTFGIYRIFFAAQLKRLSSR